MRRDLRQAVIVLNAMLGTVAAHAQAQAVQHAKRPVIGLECDLSKAGGLKDELAPMMDRAKTPELGVCEAAVDGFQGRIRAYELVNKATYRGSVDETIKVTLENRDPSRPWSAGGSLDLHMRLGGAACSAPDLCRIREILTPSLHRAGLPGSLDQVRVQIEALLGGKEAKIYRWLQLPIQVVIEEKKGLVFTNLKYSTIHASLGDLFSVGSPPVSGVPTTWLRACSRIQHELIAGPKGKTCSTIPASVQLPSGGQSSSLYYVGSERGPLGSPPPAPPLPGMPPFQIPGLSVRERPLERALEHYRNRLDGAPLGALLGGREPTSKDKNKLLDGLIEHYQRRIDSGPLVAGPAFDVASALSAQASRTSEVKSLCGTLVTSRRAREALECVSGASALGGLDKERIALQALGASPGLLPAEVREATNALPGLAALRAGIDACAAESPQPLGIEEILDTSRETGLASAVYYQLALTEQDDARRRCYLSRAAHTCLAAFGTSTPCAAPLSLARHLEATEVHDAAKLDAAVQRLFTKPASIPDSKCDWKEPFCRSVAGDSAASQALLEAHLALAHVRDARAETPPASGPLSPRFHVEAAERLWARAHPGTTLSPNLLNTALRAHLTTAVASAKRVPAPGAVPTSSAHGAPGKAVAAPASSDPTD